MANSKNPLDSRKNRTIPPKSSAAEGLQELFIDELKDIVYVERPLLKALPKMANNTSDSKLKTAIEEYITVT